MKLTTTTQLSLDGVMQSPGGPNEEESGFTRGGWAHFDTESGKFVEQVFQRADAFLFGRKTYDIFAYTWGVAPKTSKSPIAAALHKKPKYVVSSTLRDPKWNNTIILSTDFAVAIANLRAQTGGELQVHGSGQLIRWLLQNRLIDEMNLIIFPVILGQGIRLFPDVGNDFALQLIESSVKPNGVTIQVYQPKGHPEYSTITKEETHNIFKDNIDRIK
jgi:dihydrofolate reductase